MLSVVMKPDAASRYHPALAALHWLLAGLIVLALAMGALVLAQTPNTGEKLFGLRAHMIAGGLILLLMLVRIGLRFATRTPPRAVTGNAWLDRLGPAVHLLLYVGVVLLAASGITLAVQASLADAVFFGRGALPDDLWVFSARTAHYVLSRLVMLLVLLHFAGALYHRFVLRDGVLARMSLARRATP